MVSNGFLTAAQPAVTGELQCPLGAVPAVPGELKLALLDAALRPGRYTAGVDEVGLGAQQQVRTGMVCALLSPPNSGAKPQVSGWQNSLVQWPACRDKPRG